MKKSLYVAAFGFLGLLVSTLIHAGLELVALSIIFGDPANASTVWWQQWEVIHWGVATSLWVLGLLLGLVTGYKWWDRYGRHPRFFGIEV